MKMKTRKVIAFLLAAVMALSLAGCKKDENNPTAVAEKAGAKFDTLQNIKANTPATFKKEINGSTFDGPVFVPEASACYNLTMEKSTVYYDNYQKLLKIFIDNYSSENEGSEAYYEGALKEKSYSGDDMFLCTYKGGFAYEKTYGLHERIVQLCVGRTC